MSVSQDTLEAGYFMLLTAPTNPIKRQQLEEMKKKLAEANELIENLKI